MITIYILTNITRSKGSRIMKFGLLTVYNMINIFFKNQAEQEAERLVPELFFFFKRVLYEVKASGQQLNFNISWKSCTWKHNKNKSCKY